MDRGSVFHFSGVLPHRFYDNRFPEVKEICKVSLLFSYPFWYSAKIRIGTKKVMESLFDD
jgi:hypothetical protein